MARRDPARRRGVPRANPPAPRGLASGRHRAVALIALLAASAPTAARADEVDDFVEARDAYINGEYGRAWRALRLLVLTLPHNARLAPIATSIRKYYAAALFSDRRDVEARAEIEQLLREDPSANLNFTQFEPAFIRLFEDVSREMRPELDRLRAERAARAAREDAERAARRALALQMLSTETRVEHVPRGLMFVPFGVGQFANGQNGLGAAFLSIEATFSVLGIVSAQVWQAILPSGSTVFVGNPYNGEVDAAQRSRAALAQTMEILNWTSWGVVAAAAITGVVQANLAWQSERSTTLRRPIPPGLQGVEISMMPGARTLDGASLVGATLRLTF